MTRSLRLPEKLTFTALVVAAAACSGHTDGGGGPSDAGSDVIAHDSAADCDGPVSACGMGPCPMQGAFYCSAQCPPGCEPFA